MNTNQILKIATASAVAAALPINLMVDFGYTLLSLEVIGLALSFSLVGAVMGVLTANSFLYAYVLALLGYFFVEVYYFTWLPAHHVISFLIFLFLILLLRLTGTRLLLYFLVFAVVFSLAGFFQPKQPVLQISGNTANRSGNLDNSILHIVLDELATPYASEYPPPPNHPVTTLFEDLTDHGLQVYAQAYTVNVQTRHSLSSIFALDPERIEYEAFRPGSVMANRVADNKYMERLIERGYNVSVLQSSYLDYCSDYQDIFCQTYSRIGHASAFSSAPLSERMKYAFFSVHEAMRSNTRSGVFLYYVMTRLRKGNSPVLDLSVPLISYELMQGLVVKQVQAIEPGEAHFIHLLLPHFPYAFDPGCQTKPIHEWGYPDRHTPERDTARSYASYWDQVACVKSTLLEILRVTAGKDFLTTIVHGDHGARIQWLTDGANREDNLKTLLAIRSPSFEPVVKMDPVILQEAVIGSLQDLLW